MLIEINGVDGQYASIDPAYVVWANVYERSAGGWVAAVRCSTGSDMCSSISNEFGPFEGKADADAIVRRVTEAANEAQSVICNPDVVESPVERESEFVEFVNNEGMRTAVNRTIVTSVRVWPGASEEREAAWQVRIGLRGEQSVWAPFTTDRAEADELFDRLTR